MREYYYDHEHECYMRKKYRKKHRHHCYDCECDCHCRPRYQTLTTGPLFWNTNIDFVQVSALNESDEPQTVIISILNYRNNCNGIVFPTFGYLCGQLVNSDSGGSNGTLQNRECGDSEDDIYCPPEGVTPFLTPVRFTIPPRQLFSVRAFAPQEPIIPQDPHYVVRVTAPQDPFQPVDPTSPVTVNTWGINFAGVIQQGNTVLHRQFVRSPGDPTSPVDPV
ncbi:TPA: sodium:proton exchanger [Bacillus pseudomycoides]|nr:sodium:proton exchanger [Bacillus pseudomycoides]